MTMLMLLLAVVVCVAGYFLVRALSRRSSPRRTRDLGHVSEHWLEEQRAGRTKF